jgi:CheY-like chemotaxis protein
MKSQVLIVEDDPDVRSALRDLLADEGYDPVEAVNGLEAIEYLRKGNRPGLIVLDLGMPVVNGWEFRSVQRSIPAMAEIPVVILTASPETEADLAWMAPADCIRKPVDVDRFLGTVRRYCA